jgi:hypothetical protein
VVTHRSARGALLPAATIAAALLAGIGATYALVGSLSHPPGAASPAARPPQGEPPTAATHPRPPGLPARPRTSQGAGPSTSAGSGPGAGAATERAELAQVSALLRRSAASRAVVLATTRAVASCTLLPGVALAQLDAAIAARQILLTDSGTLPVAAIPAGVLMRADLAAALRYSIAADRGFAHWMGDVQQAGTCPVSLLADDSYVAGLHESALASRAKARFLRLWDPLAAGLGQPVFTRGQI